MTVKFKRGEVLSELEYLTGWENEGDYGLMAMSLGFLGTGDARDTLCLDMKRLKDK
jgi:hypothetical protein